jgi:hypothetical protein
MVAKSGYDIVRYAKQYHSILSSGNASPLLKLSTEIVQTTGALNLRFEMFACNGIILLA